MRLRTPSLRRIAWLWFRTVLTLIVSRCAMSALEHPSTSRTRTSVLVGREIPGGQRPGLGLSQQADQRGLGEQRLALRGGAERRDELGGGPVLGEEPDAARLDRVLRSSMASSREPLSRMTFSAGSMARSSIATPALPR